MTSYVTRNRDQTSNVNHRLGMFECRITKCVIVTCHLSLLEEERCVGELGLAPALGPSLSLGLTQHFTSVKLIITPISRCTTWCDIHVHVNTKCVVKIHNSFKPTTPADSRKLSKLGCLLRIFSAKGGGTLNSAKEKFRKKELFLAQNANFSPF